MLFELLKSNMQSAGVFGQIAECWRCVHLWKAWSECDSIWFQWFQHLSSFRCTSGCRLEPQCIAVSVQVFLVILSYYRAKLRVARYCQGKLSVRLSVCLSVTLRYRDHIGSNSWKIISRLISLTSSLFADPNMTDLLQRTPPNFSRNRSGVGKIVDFRHLSRRISETVQDRVQVAIDH